MGKFNHVPRNHPPVDSDVIKDIENQVLSGKKVVIVHTTSESSRNAVSLLLKKLPSDVLYRVRPIEASVLEHHRRTDPSTDYYQISAEGILGYLPKS